MSDTVTLPAADLASLEHLVETLEESLTDAQRVMATDDYGWQRVGDMSRDGVFSRDTIKDATRLARVMAIADPLIRRAVSLWVAYVWGQGCTTAANQEVGAEQDVNAVVQAFLDDPGNAAVFTSAQAREELERKLQTDGEFFHALVTSPLSGRVQVREVPCLEVGDIITNPEDSAQVWFYKRTFTARRMVRQGSATVTSTSTETVLYPDVTYRPATRARSIDGHEVRWDSPVVHTKVNPSGGRGTPDLYAALPWARGYKGFLEDWAGLVKALSRFAFRATAKNRAGGAAVRAKIAAAPAATDGTVGATVVTGESQTFEAIGKSGATIDSNSGRPLAAMVAAATNIPVTMLLADPGVTGARATAETLDAPFHQVINARRTLHADLIRAVLGYVVREAVRAPAGPLKGTVLRDPASGREVVALRGEQELTLTVDFPRIEKLDVKVLMDAIVAADGMDKLPPLLIARLAMLALDVDDVDEWLDQVTDDNGDFLDPTVTVGDTAAAAAAKALPATAPTPHARCDPVVAVTGDTWKVAARLRSDAAAITDAQVRAMVLAYANAWDEVAADLEDAVTDLIRGAGERKVTRAMVSRSRRLREALALIGDRLDKLAAESGAMVIGDLRSAVATATAAQDAILATQLPKDVAAHVLVSFDRAPTGALDVMLHRVTQQIHAATQPLSGEAVDVMKRELVRGLVGGTNPNETAARMVRRCQGVFEGGAARAARIARTETLDAMRSAQHLQDQANTGTLRGWQWVASLSSRTCPACWSMHGTEHPVLEPGPLGHQNCRCARVPLLKSWRELGFNVDEPADLVHDAGDAFGALPKERQVQVLGQKRWDAWDRGDYPMSSWAARRENSGWRDSYVTSPAA